MKGNYVIIYNTVQKESVKMEPIENRPNEAIEVRRLWPKNMIVCSIPSNSSLSKSKIRPMYKNEHAYMLNVYAAYIFNNLLRVA